MPALQDHAANMNLAKTWLPVYLSNLSSNIQMEKWDNKCNLVGTHGIAGLLPVLYHRILFVHSPQHLLNIYRITSECRLITEYLVLPGHLTVQGVCEGARARGEQSLLPQAEEAAAARAGAERVRWLDLHCRWVIWETTAWQVSRII